MRRKKITVVGGGNVGATAAQRIAEKELGDVVLIDILDGYAAGKGLDMMQSGPVERFDSKITGTCNFEPMKDSDLVIITAGLARKPGMDRLDLFKKNQEIVTGISKQIKKYAPDSIIIVVTNPLDVMSYVAMKVTGFPKERVIGMAGALDSARFSAFIGMELDVSVKNISSMVLGGHGDEMVPLTRFTTVGGIPVTELLDDETLERIIQRTKTGGGEIVKLLKSGSAYYAPSAGAVDMAEAVIRDQKRILPCSVLLEGEYGIHDVFIGVPVKIGGNGIEQVYEVALTEDEQTQLEHSAQLIRAKLNEISL
jgi:malate dehydrogenase